MRTWIVFGTEVTPSVRASKSMVPFSRSNDRAFAVRASTTADQPQPKWAVPNQDRRRRRSYRHENGNSESIRRRTDRFKSHPKRSHRRSPQQRCGQGKIGQRGIAHSTNQPLGINPRFQSRASAVTNSLKVESKLTTSS